MFLSFFSQSTLLTDGQTDGRTDISLVAKTALHRCSAEKRKGEVNERKGKEGRKREKKKENVLLKIFVDMLDVERPPCDRHPSI